MSICLMWHTQAHARENMYEFHSFIYNILYTFSRAYACACRMRYMDMLHTTKTYINFYTSMNKIHICKCMSYATYGRFFPVSRSSRNSQGWRRPRQKLKTCRLFAIWVHHNRFWRRRLVIRYIRKVAEGTHSCRSFLFSSYHWRHIVRRYY